MVAKRDVKEGSDTGAEYQYIPRITVIVRPGIWQMALSSKYKSVQSVFSLRYASVYNPWALKVN